MRPVVLAVLVACGASEPAPPPPPPSFLVPVVHDAMPDLHALGIQALVPKTDDNDAMIPAFAPCTRPTVEEQNALMGRVEAWAKGPIDSIRFGCVQPAGVIVAVQADRDGASKYQPRGSWWTLRVGRTVTKLDEVTGLGLGAFMEWAREATLTTVALADLDGDGVLDALDAREDKEGGSPVGDVELRVVLSTGPVTSIASFAQHVDAARDVVAPGPIVVRIEGRDDHVAYRCVGGDRTLATCPGAELARAHDEAAAAARTLASLKQLPDRDELARLLAAIGVHDRPELFLAAPPTSPEERIARDIVRWATPPDDRTASERMADDTRELTAHVEAIRALLGDRACTNGDAADVRRWARARPGAADVLATCGPNALVAWTEPLPADAGLPRSRRTSALVYDRTVLAEATGESEGTPLGEMMPADLDARFTRHGDHNIATVLRQGTIEVFVDGKSIAKRDGIVRYPRDAIVTADSIIEADDGAILAVEPSGLVEVSTLAPIAARTAELAARSALQNATAGDLDTRRADVLADLATLHAPDALIARVRALP